MTRPNVRDSRIPCPNCKKSTLYWNSEEKIYVCTFCGVQEAALDTWIEAGVHRKSKKEKKKDKDRKWALDILGVEDGLTIPRKSKEEQQWDEVAEMIKKKQEKS